MTPSPKSPSSGYPFVFVGAGDAAYADTCLVRVRFTKAPDVALRAKILRGLPPELAKSVAWDGADLSLESPPSLGEVLAAKGDDEADLFARFNAALEAWLMAAHLVSPILVAWWNDDRDDDAGSAASPWHKDSVRRVPELLPAFAATLKGKPETIGAGLLACLLDAADDAGVGPPGSPELTRFRSPASGVRALLVAGDAAGLRAALSASTPVADMVAEQLCAFGFKLADPRILRALAASADLLSKAQLFSDATVNLLTAAVASRYDLAFDPALVPARDGAIATLAKKVAADGLISERLGRRGSELLAIARWREARDLFDLALTGPKNAPETFSNAVWVLQKDNTGLPVDAARNERTLKICLPRAQKNPDINVNAACLFIEMGDLDRAVEQVALALSRGFKDRKRLRKDPVLVALADHPEFIRLLGA